MDEWGQYKENLAPSQKINSEILGFLNFGPYRLPGMFSLFATSFGGPCWPKNRVHVFGLYAPPIFSYSQYI